METIIGAEMMKQSKLMSFAESVSSTFWGFLISLCIQYAIVWWYELPLGTSQNLLIIAIFTVASIIRGYVHRRAMEALHVRNPISPFMLAVIAERRRQKEVEGWTEAHDDTHGRGDLALAGAAYLIGPEKRLLTDYDDVDERTIPVSGRLLWPWEIDWWKPQEFRRNLVRGCALGVAEGEKCDRQRVMPRPRRRVAE